ncbi:amidohydrolase [Sanguibacter sp. HDW7]|uniref:amidohydrolase n=1 Tax=Sanguibacter sp. HDW7 TaxID=2714931 RepID=UPI00197F7D26|nr:amidohydrolase [Sanguibacter sp. HDW7]
MTSQNAPDVLLVGGHVFTAAPHLSTGTGTSGTSVPSGDMPVAAAVAITGERITAVGPDDELRALAGPATRIVDITGRLVLPGFQDTHVHPILAAGMDARLNVLGESDLAGTLGAISAWAAAHPELEWVTGWGWQADHFEGGFPTRQQLDALVPDRPAFLHRSDGHASWVNTRAIELAGLDDDGSGQPPADPAGGYVQRDADGRATGVLIEWATGLVEKHVPDAPLADRLAHLLAGQRALLAQGITAWQDASVRPAEQEVYELADARGELVATVVGALRWEHERGFEQVAKLVERRAEIEARSAARPSRFRPTSVKIMHDGVVDGSLTAAMIDPYLDADGTVSDNRGDSYHSVDDLDRLVAALMAEGFQPHFHAIGDRGVRECLDAVERARAVLASVGVAPGGVTADAHPGVDVGHAPHHDGTGRDVRPIVSHVQVVHPDDRARLAGLGTIVSAQPLWANCEDVQTELTMPFLGEERSAWQYPFASLAAAGALLAGGSDWPVSTADPLQGIHTAVTRRLFGEDRPALYPSEALTLAEAVRMYTYGSAVANHREDESGVVAPGLLADLAIIDRDIFAAPVDEIGEARVVATWVRGVEVHTAP